MYWVVQNVCVLSLDTCIVHTLVQLLYVCVISCMYMYCTAQCLQKKNFCVQNSVYIHVLYSSSLNVFMYVHSTCVVHTNLKWCISEPYSNIKFQMEASTVCQVTISHPLQMQQYYNYLKAHTYRNTVCSTNLKAHSMVMIWVVDTTGCTSYFPEFEPVIRNQTHPPYTNEGRFLSAKPFSHSPSTALHQLNRFCRPES